MPKKEGRHLGSLPMPSSRSGDRLEVWVVLQDAIIILRRAVSVDCFGRVAIDRGPKNPRRSIFSIRRRSPSVLLEICFVRTQRRTATSTPINSTISAKHGCRLARGSAKTKQPSVRGLAEKSRTPADSDDMVSQPERRTRFHISTSDQPDLFLSYQPE